VPEFVYMTHPDVDAVAGPVSRQAFDEVHVHKGWRLAEPAAAVASQALDVGVTDLDGLTKDALLEVAASLGLDPGPKKTKAELTALIRSVAPATHPPQE